MVHVDTVTCVMYGTRWHRDVRHVWYTLTPWRASSMVLVDTVTCVMYGTRGHCDVRHVWYPWTPWRAPYMIHMDFRHAHIWYTWTPWHAPYMVHVDLLQTATCRYLYTQKDFLCNNETGILTTVWLTNRIKHNSWAILAKRPFVVNPTFVKFDRNLLNLG